VASKFQGLVAPQIASETAEMFFYTFYKLICLVLSRIALFTIFTTFSERSCSVLYRSPHLIFLRLSENETVSEVIMNLLVSD